MLSFHNVLYNYHVFCKNDKELNIFTTNFAMPQSMRIVVKREYNDYMINETDKSRIIGFDFFFNSLFNTNIFSYVCKICNNKMMCTMNDVIKYYSVQNGTLGCNRAFCLSDKESIKSLPFYNNFHSSLCYGSQHKLAGISINYENTSTKHYTYVGLCEFIKTYIDHREEILDFYQGSTLRGNVLQYICDKRRTYSYKDEEFEDNKMEICEELARENTHYKSKDAITIYSKLYTHSLAKSLYKELCEMMLIICNALHAESVYANTIKKGIKPLRIDMTSASRASYVKFENIVRVYDCMMVKYTEEVIKEKKSLIKKIDFGCSDINYVVYGFLFDITTFFVES